MQALQLWTEIARYQDPNQSRFNYKTLLRFLWRESINNLTLTLFVFFVHTTLIYLSDRIVETIGLSVYDHKTKLTILFINLLVRRVLQPLNNTDLFSFSITLAIPFQKQNLKCLNTACWVMQIYIITLSPLSIEFITVVTIRYLH